MAKFVVRDKDSRMFIGRNIKSYLQDEKIRKGYIVRYNSLLVNDICSARVFNSLAAILNSNVGIDILPGKWVENRGMSYKRKLPDSIEVIEVSINTTES